MALREKSNEELLRLYNDDLVLRLHNTKNLRDTRTLLSHFMGFLGQFPPSPELAKGFLARYADYNAHTLYRYTQMITTFMKWYGEPLTDVHIKIPKSLPSYIKDEDIEKLLAVIGDKRSHKGVIERDRLLVEVAYKTGLRRGELANLDPEEIHENALIVRKGKGKKDRMIPLTDDMAKRLHAFIKDHKPGQSVFGLGAPSISMKIKQFARKAGLPHIHAHSLRHKFATDLLEAGVDLKVVQALMGHENLNTTEVYLSLTDERLHDAIKKREQYKNGAKAGKSMIQAQAETSLYVETSHKQQISESAKTLIHQIDFPFIGERLRNEITVRGAFPQKPLKRDWFSGNIILEGLRKHLYTGGYSKVLQYIDDFDKEDSDNLVRCHEFIDLVKKEVEKIFQVSIPIIDNGEQGFTISFVQTVCADAIERARGTNHYRDFRYHVEGVNLKFGAYIIYAGTYGQDLKPYEDIHRRMRENCFSWKQSKNIANQISRIGEIQQTIRVQLETFALLERVPGECHLCSTPKDTA